MTAPVQPAPPLLPDVLGYTERQLLAEILLELRALNGNIARLEQDLRPLIPFRPRLGRRGN